MAKPKRDILYLEFLVSLFLFVLYISLYLGEPLHHYPLAPLYTLLILAYSVLYIVKGRGSTGHVWRVTLHILFAVLVLLFLALFAMPYTLFHIELLTLVSMVTPNLFYFIFLLPLYFIFALAAYLYLVAGRRGPALIVFALGVAIAAVFFLYMVSAYQFGDEILIAFEADGQFLHGIDPYTASIQSLLYSNFSTVGGTPTTSNSLISTMDYPALYFLSLLPFYLAAPHTLYSLGHSVLSTQAFVFTILLLLAILFVTERKKRFEFRLAALVFLVLAVSTVTSITALIMLSLLLIAYAKLDSRYAFIPIGLALSIQQEIWLPAALLLLFSLNNYGLRKGARDILGALAIFLIINGYFIYLNPQAFVSDVLLPIGNIIPFNASPLGGFILFNYHVSLALSGVLILASTAIVALLSLYWNRKALIPILSVIPLFFVFHALNGYYTFYAAFLVYALLLTPPAAAAGRGWLTALLRRNLPLFYSAIAVVVVAAAILTYQSHLGYLRSFNLTVENQTLSYSGNTTIYNADIVYHNMTNSTVFFYMQGYSDNASKYLLYGIENDSLTGEAPQCAEVRCLLNVNMIDLPSNASVYHLRVSLNGSNATELVTYAHALFYNGDYIYDTYNVQNSST